MIKGLVMCTDSGSRGKPFLPLSLKGKERELCFRSPEGALAGSMADGRKNRPVFLSPHPPISFQCFLMDEASLKPEGREPGNSVHRGQPPEAQSRQRKVENEWAEGKQNKQHTAKWNPWLQVLEGCKR